MINDARKSNPHVAAAAQDPFEVFDHPQIQAQFLTPESLSSPAGKQSARLQLENIRCAGCCGAIEKAISGTHGVSSAELNYSSHQLQLTWDPATIAFSDILRKLNQLGYPAHPIKSELRVSQLVQERKRLIRQIGVAGAFGMQVMVLSVCLYTGDWWGMDPVFKTYFEYLSLLLVIPIMLYSVAPFLRGAFDDLRHGRVGIDVPISLGLGIAFVASSYATLSGSGETYFDSIGMFAFLVLGARLFEIGNRIKATSALGQYDSVMPDSACLLGPDSVKNYIPTLTLKPGDRVWVDTGDVIPADSVITKGESSLDESLLTGESLPVSRRAGEQVVAGSINVENPLELTVQRTGEHTMLSGIARLVAKSQFEKPRVNQAVEKLSSWFVVIVLSIATAVALTGYLAGSEHWLRSTIAVLIVSCPCALALATPAAISMAMGNALNAGLLVSNSRALEILNNADHFFFDKTGTLTTGRFEISQITPNERISAGQAISIACALEGFSTHPIAKAFQHLNPEQRLQVDDLRTETGGGISGRINGSEYFLGNPDFIARQTKLAADRQDPANGTLAVLADQHGVLCTFVLQDQIRAGAGDWVQRIKKSGAQVSLLSGDQSAVVEAVAAELNITDYASGCTPEGKLARVAAAGEQGSITAMVGDGLNDAPVIGSAHVSVAVGDRANMSTIAADIVVMNPNTVPALEHLSALSRQLSRVIRQNLTWALGYNAFAIPFAAVGLVPPWLAAIGMSLSSLLVVLNATRLGRWSPGLANDSDRVAFNIGTTPSNLSAAG